MADDAELLRRYANERSEEAFTALVRRHLPLVYHGALRRTNGDVHLAEDVAQTVFARLARDAGSLHRHAVLAGWLFVATRHAAANAMRAEERRKTREEEAHVMSESSAPDVSEIEWAQLRPELDSVMDELAEADRDAVLLRYFENRPYADIGASLRISEDAARMRVERALEKLRTLLARRGITSTAAALGGLLVAQSAVAAPTGLAATVTGSVLAGAAGTVAATSGVATLTFMTTNKIVMAVAGVATALSIGAALHEWRDNRRLANELAAADRGLEVLRAQLGERERQVRQTGETRRTAQAPVGKAESSSAVSDPATGDSAKGSQPSKAKTAPATLGAVTIFKELPFANPEYMRLQIELSAVGTQLQFGPLYRKLGWSPQKIEEFERLTAQQHQNSFDIMAAANANGVSLSNPELGKQWNDPSMQEPSAKLRQLLGEGDYAVYLEYNDMRSLVARTSIEMLAGNLYYTDTPLTEAQAGQLSAAIVRNTLKPVPTSGVTVPTQPDWETIYAQSGVFLTPQQLTTLRAVNARNDLGLQSHKLMMQILKEAGALPAGSN